MVHQIFNEYKVLHIKAAYIMLVKNKFEMDKHAIGSALGRIDYKRLMTKSLYCQTYLRKELEDALIIEILGNNEAIYRVITSDYTANKVRDLISKKSIISMRKAVEKILSN